MLLMSKRWYVVQSKSKHELIAYEQLKNQRYNVFLPQLAEVKRIRGQNIKQNTPMFPSYLFVEFDITRAKWRSILGTRGVQHLLGSTDIYASPLPKGFIEDLIKQADKAGCVSIKQANKTLVKYRPGDQLKIKEGLFSGLSGTCHKIQKDFAVLLLSLLSGDFEIKLPLSLVEPA